jgi:hypothetical protein
LTKDEALKLTLDWLESGEFFYPTELRTAIKEALAQPDYRAVKTYHEGKPVYVAQPAQEPVAWMTINEYEEEDDIHYENPEGHLLEGWTYKPLYTTPQPAQRPWVGLTDEERSECVNTPFSAEQWANIETKLKEKNT